MNDKKIKAKGFFFAFLLIPFIILFCMQIFLKQLQNAGPESRQFCFAARLVRQWMKG